MPDHDHDLIAALAEGRLEPDRAAEAERAIADDPAAAELLAAHRRALAAIGAASHPSLTDTERNALHLRVSEAVGLDRTPQTVTRRRAPWAAVAIAGAALVALVAAVPLMNLLSDSGDAVAITSGVAEADDAARSTGELGEAPAPSDLGTETFGESDGLGGTVSTTMAASAPTAQESLTLVERLTTLIDEPRDPGDDRLSPTEETACGMEAEELIGTALADLRFAELTIDERQALVFFTVVEGHPEMAAVFSADGCELLESLP